MNIPFLDLKAQYKSIKEEVLPAINNVLDNTAYVLGKPVVEFEQSFASAHGSKYCYCVNSGTAGNHMVLWALGVGPGDEVIIPNNTFIATAWGATLCGATPVFVDCHPESYNIDPEKIVAAITPNTKAIVAVHLYGQAADMEEISRQLAVGSWQLEEKEKGVFVNKDSGQTIYLVEDCAQAHIAEYKSHEIENQISRDRWVKVGSLGIASSFSF